MRLETSDIAILLATAGIGFILGLFLPGLLFSREEAFEIFSLTGQIGEFLGAFSVLLLPLLGSTAGLLVGIAIVLTANR